MHPLQNGSQVVTRPANKPASGLPGYFTESGDNNIPSYPGADWFNHVIDEFLNALDSLGITFDPQNDTNLAAMFSYVSSLATTLNSIGDRSSLVGKTSPGQRIVWLGYYSPLDGGGNSGVIKQGAHVEDGGSIFSIDSNTYIEADLIGKEISTLHFGDRADGSDQKTAFDKCVAFCKNNGIGEIRVLKDTALSQYNFPVGITFRGRGYQSYGEFATGQPTTISLLASSNQWGIIFPTLTAVCGGFVDINLDGINWLNNGVDFPDTCREVVFRNVSIKGVRNGIRENDLFKSKLDVTITAREIGYHSRGGGTTTDLSGVLVQGDKVNGIRCQTPFKFDESGKSQPKNSSQINIGGAQYCEDVFQFEGSPRLVISSFNAEDWTGACYRVGTTYKMKLDVVMPTAIPENGAVIWAFDGDVHPETEIWQRSIAASDNVDITPTIKFMQDGPSINPRGVFYMEYHLYSRIIGQCDPLSRQLIRVNDFNSHTGGSGILLSGASEYRVPFSNLTALYSNMFLYDFNNQRLTLTGTGWQFGNGLTFSITSSALSGGSPIVSQISIRTQAPTSFNKVDIAGSLNVTVDFSSGELVVTPVSTTQSIVIKPA
ncbi:hypothetical protein KUM02_000400 [Vibrio parahaemolyticus]|nr:hypothetical protein [Vibrio parahaemolyticus]